MSTESSAREFEVERTISHKESVLSWLVTDEIRHEVELMREGGYDISFGDSDDSAYERPDAIVSVYDMLHQRGNAFAREMGKFDVGHQAVLSTLRFAAPFKPVRNWAKGRLASRNAKAEELRSTLLYDRADIQGAAWHDQNGKALALGTIVDAAELNDGSGDLLSYETMSGRLNVGILDYKFESNAGWLEGLGLQEAITKSEMDFRGHSAERARSTAVRELQRLHEFSQSPVKTGFKDIVLYCTDSLGIRSRKEEVRKEINRHVDESDKKSFLMMSVGCGTALPMLEVMDDLKQKNRDSKLILIDQDPIALAAAAQFAGQMGLQDSIEIHCQQLFHGKGRQTRLLDLQTVLQGRQLDVCEDSGLREYFPDFLYKDLTKQAWNSLTDDGIMTTGNMNKNRPQAEFLHGLMGWPIPVQMRNVSDVATLHADAGVPASASRLRVTQDGVYTLCFSSKSKSANG